MEIYLERWSGTSSYDKRLKNFVGEEKKRVKKNAQGWVAREWRVRSSREKEVGL